MTSDNGAKTGNGLAGVYAAALTPILDDLQVDHERLAAHCRSLMQRGCDGVCLFGTTGEGTSFAVDQRLEALAAVLQAGVTAEKLVIGTASAALEDAVRLARGSLNLGCSALLALPPFFFKDVDSDGVYRFYAELVERVDDSRMALYLYNIPSFSGVPLQLDTIERLATQYPQSVVGIKDSSADWSYTSAVLERFPGLQVLVGAEPHLPRALAKGARGTICGMANLAPRTMEVLYQNPDRGEALRAVEEFLDVLLRYPIFAGLKAVLASHTKDPAWKRLLPPLTELEDDATAELLTAFDDFLTPWEDTV